MHLFLLPVPIFLLPQQALRALARKTRHAARLRRRGVLHAEGFLNAAKLAAWLNRLACLYGATSWLIKRLVYLTMPERHSSR